MSEDSDRETKPFKFVTAGTNSSYPPNSSFSGGEGTERGDLIGFDARFPHQNQTKHVCPLSLLLLPLLFLPTINSLKCEGANIFSGIAIAVLAERIYLPHPTPPRPPHHTTPHQAPHTSAPMETNYRGERVSERYSTSTTTSASTQKVKTLPRVDSFTWRIGRCVRIVGSRGGILFVVCSLPFF